VDVVDREAEPTVVIERGGNGAALFLLGAAIGAGIALMLAPRTGEETRAAVRRTARKAKRRAREFAENGEEMVEELVRTGKAAAEDMVETGRSAVRDMKRSGKSAARDARSALEQRLAKHRDESFDGEDDGV
jgi:gas vesicle protein